MNLTEKFADLHHDIPDAKQDAYEALKLASETFDRYAELHWKKGTEEGKEKARANAALGLMMRNAMEGLR